MSWQMSRHWPHMRGDDWSQKKLQTVSESHIQDISGLGQVRIRAF